MPKAMFDTDALISQFESASAAQGDKLRQLVADTTLQALQGRELTLRNVRATLKAVADAAGQGVAKNALPDVDPTTLLDKAVAGMDDAMLKAVEAHRVALGQLAARGADLTEGPLGKALAELDKFEDSIFQAVRKASEGAGAPFAAAWGQALEKMQAGGTLSGAKAGETAEQLAAQMQRTLPDSRNAGLRAAKALADSYTAMVSGVLIGMSDALSQGGTAKPGGRARGSR